MSLRKKGYTDRLIDKELSELLEIFGAVSIEGPKYCGKTWTALNHANSSVLLSETNDPSSDYQRALINRKLIFKKEYPELLDEWQSIVQIWDDVRSLCDEDGKKGKFILTGSATPADQKKIFHSGAGRIFKLNMYTMSLFESNDSDGSVSLTDLFNGNDISCNLKIEPTLEHLADVIVRGGWPDSLKIKRESYFRLPESYIVNVLDHDINYDGVKRDKDKMLRILKSLARNESTLVSNKKIINDIDDYEDNQTYQLSRITLADYLNILSNLHITDNIIAYSENIRSSVRVGKKSKRHFVDPSLACSLLGIKQQRLINDLETFGFLFESLVLRDLRIYSGCIGGKLYHFHDNDTKEEVDAIVELADGVYGAIEIKLGLGQIDEAAKNLIKFSNKCTIKPKFLCVISGLINYAGQRPDGVYVVPITALRP